MEYLQSLIDELIPLLNNADWRMIAMLTEEAGEVQGAFNKWKDGRIDKPKTLDDVREELTQLTACCFIAARSFGMPSDGLKNEIEIFLNNKIDQMEGWRNDKGMA